MRRKVAVVHEYIRDIDNSVLSRGTTSTFHGGIYSSWDGEVLGIKTCQESNRSKRVWKDCRENRKSVSDVSISGKRIWIFSYFTRRESRC